ncbi:GNAT family N-acetyltransferase [Candidatus Epulonipiscium fishelsonii]|uniref:GNAT family N-acetyltransferase n=1 Tax=Candidatus Epulonipiscium fishelsonii TaxID=77094 RepID=A0ACC8X8K8_9FIRM|nr:GNAT family N-acetyltransferase [Epulopiscium sp. SCG-B11WGA-EpuloA1]ONI38946.1 GNAT family N-acetyltransferase [Epulopiscium sp. SCG-B05WGA-EpuloA1]
MINIREATIDDLEYIVNFNSLLAQETEDKELDKKVLTRGVKYLLENEQYGIYHVAEKENKVVGQVMYTFEWSDWRNGLFLWIQSVYVDKNYRQQGVFTRLYNQVKSICDKNDNIVGIRLYAEKENDIAQQVYTKLGMNKCHYDMFEYEK